MNDAQLLYKGSSTPMCGISCITHILDSTLDLFLMQLYTDCVILQDEFEANWTTAFGNKCTLR